MLDHGHNLNTSLVTAADEIVKEHQELLVLIEDTEAKAKRIGNLLVALKPTLKSASVSISDFCKDYLPFSKSAAYEYMAIAQGKTTLAQETVRKNNSASAESFDPERIAADQFVSLNYNNYDTYNEGYQLVCDIVDLDQRRAEHVQAGNIKAAKDISSTQDQYAEMLKMSLDTIRTLHQLIMNDDANIIGLTAGGSGSQHPLWDAYSELINPEIIRDCVGGPAEDWCCEAMFHTWLRMEPITPEQRTEFIETYYGQRKPFWWMAVDAAEKYNDEAALISRINSTLDSLINLEERHKVELAEFKEAAALRRKEHMSAINDLCEQHTPAVVIEALRGGEATAFPITEKPRNSD